MCTASVHASTHAVMHTHTHTHTHTAACMPVHSAKDCARSLHPRALATHLDVFVGCALADALDQDLVQVHQLVQHAGRQLARGLQGSKGGGGATEVCVGSGWVSGRGGGQFREGTGVSCMLALTDFSSPPM